MFGLPSWVGARGLSSGFACGPPFLGLGSRVWPSCLLLEVGPFFFSTVKIVEPPICKEGQTHSHEKRPVYTLGESVKPSVGNKCVAGIEGKKEQPLCSPRTTEQASTHAVTGNRWWWQVCGEEGRGGEQWWWLVHECDAPDCGHVQKHMAPTDR